jgi:hypothetical protein
MNNFDFHTLVGTGGLTIIESFVQYLKDQWSLPGKLAPLAAIVAGIGLNEVAAYSLHMDLLSALYVGVATGVASSFWHEVRTAN